jgi:hypothetical protein
MPYYAGWCGVQASLGAPAVHVIAHKQPGGAATHAQIVTADRGIHPFNTLPGALTEHGTRLPHVSSAVTLHHNFSNAQAMSHVLRSRQPGPRSAAVSDAALSLQALCAALAVPEGQLAISSWFSAWQPAGVRFSLPANDSSAAARPITSGDAVSLHWQSFFFGGGGRFLVWTWCARWFHTAIPASKQLLSVQRRRH